jgi:hypothetical protein
MSAEEGGEFRETFTFLIKGDTHITGITSPSHFFPSIFLECDCDI